MKLKTIYGIAILSTILAFPFYSQASGGSVHMTLGCIDCHATQPLEGQPVDFRDGGPEQGCNACHNKSGSQPPIAISREFSAALAVTTENIVNQHPSSGTIPEAMKQWMIEWYSARGYTYGNPSVPWTYGCGTCHLAHNAPYPYLLRFTLENGELCSLCHGGEYNAGPDWLSIASRRVLYGPDHLGHVQGDGVTEQPAPSALRNGDTVSGTVNFPLAVFSGFHRKTADIAYRIDIPGSLLGSIDVNPANYLSWYLGSEAASWDTTQEADGAYTVSIIPYKPSTLEEALPLSFILTVSNLTNEDRICAFGAEIGNANIRNKGIENSLLVKAENACKAVRAGNLEAAEGILYALVREIEAQAGKHIPPEAAEALIAYVREFLSLLQ